MHPGPARTVFILSALFSSGCFSIHYALQAGAGEVELLAGARPIDEILERTDTPNHLRRLLESVAQVKAFGVQSGLTETQSYQRYEELHRPSAIYVVSACPELSLQPRLIHFPIAGAVPYLGWFSLRAARDYARSLEEEGLDVDLRGASAFSTLGWFNDPLLSSMIGPGPESLGQLANTVLHESVHATLYLPGQTPFNEGLAEAIADHLSSNYLAAHASPREQRAWRDEQRRRGAIELQLHEAADRLDALYRSKLSAEEKRMQKQLELAALSDRLHLRRKLNNALLAEHRAYSAGKEGFARLLAACNGDLPCLFTQLRPLNAKSFARPNDDQIDGVLAVLADKVRPRTIQ